MPNWSRRRTGAESGARLMFPYCVRTAVIVAVLILALMGGLFHHHESSSECAACLLCHTAVQTPVASISGSLATFVFRTVGVVSPDRDRVTVPAPFFGPVAPRAPPATLLEISRESGAMLV